MGILGPHGLSLYSPFCDALNVTVPLEHSDELQASFRPLLVQLGATDCGGGFWEIPRLAVGFDGRLVSLASTGKQKPASVAFRRVGQVVQFAASGGSLSSMRLSGLYDHCLSVIGSFPHRVTRLDATVDIRLPASGAVMGLYQHVKEHGLKLGRKKTPPSRCRALLRQSHYLDESGFSSDTGSVYVGEYGSAEICLKVYDKRNEVIDRGGDDPGPWLRAELTFSGQVGCTLRDASRPGPLFWNYAAGLLDPPGDFESWQKGDTGFDLQRPPPVDPVVAITRACERNEGLRTVIRFSDSLGFARAHLWGYMNHAHPVGVAL